MWGCTRYGLLGNLCTSLIQQGDDSLARFSYLSFQESIHFYFSLLLVSLQGTHEGIPGREVLVAVKFHGNRTVKSAARIPSAAFLYIVEMNLYEILLSAKLHVRCDVDAEGIVAVSPSASLLAIHAHHRLTHRTIKYEDGTLVALRQLKIHLIHALSNPRESSRASRLLGLLLFAILLDSHHLQVPFLIERTRNSPVVRHGYLRPRFTVAGEIPRWQINDFSALCLAHGRERQGERHESNASLDHIFFF